MSLKIAKHGNVKVATRSYEIYLNSSSFVQGWKDYRSGKSPRFDELFAYKSEGRTIYGRRSYETGRQFAACFPELKNLRIGTKVDPKAVLKLREAIQNKWILP